MKKKILSIVKYLIFVLMGIGLIWLAFKNADFEKIKIEFKNANYIWIAISVIPMLISHLFRAIRWNQLLGTLDCKTKKSTTFYAVLIGYFANLFVPRIGEITRCGVVATRYKMPINSVIGTVIAERAFDMVSLIVIIIITIISQLSLLTDFLNKNFIEPILSKFYTGTHAFVIIASILIGIFTIFYIIYRALLPKLRGIKLFNKILDLIKGFWEGIKTIKNVKHKNLFILYSIGMWTMYALTMYISFMALSSTKHLSFIDAITLMSIGSIGVLAPTPGGIGAYQYVLMLTLIGVYNIAESTAFSYANIVYFAQWFMFIILGGLSWIMLILSQKKELLK
ncbi:MAG: flippase-like domain-containing protein [Bacteroidetes bacterium]|nr:flippase-like domain-containing protein [Bacteroidota bacterium]